MAQLLIVDNHPLMRQYLTELLGKEGHDVHTAADGLAALDCLRKLRPQVIFVDLIMPNIDGLTLCRILRRLPEHAQAYVVILSAAAVEAPELVERSGANAAIAKGPFKTLGPAVLELLREAQRQGFRGFQAGVRVVEDISAREITRELVLQKRHYELVLESLGEGLLELTGEARVVFANRSTLEILELPEERLLGCRLEELFPEPDGSKGALRSLLDSPQTGGQPGPEIEVQRGQRQLSLRVYPSCEPGGRTVILLTDVSERRRMEEHLRQAQRLESVGTLAAGVAHDFNNLLMTIEGSASLMRADLAPSHPHWERLQEIERQVQSAKRLTGQLLGYSRRGRYETRVFDLNELVRDTAETYGRTRKALTIRLELAAELDRIQGDMGQIEQMLLNLMLNAGDAMPSGGTLCVSTRNASNRDMSTGQFTAREGRYVLLTVRDTGVGMDAATLQRIFEPFYTTKEMGRGTGLGLASAYGTVKGHGGYIEVESQPGEGSTFGVFLPALSPEQELTAGPAPPADNKRRPVVLLIDDEAPVRKVAGDMLENLGHSVLRAGSAEEALGLLEQNLDRVDLAVLDLIMPGVSGAEVFRRLRQLRPGLPVLLCSGYSREEEAERLLREGASAFIQKPFGLARLAEGLGRLRGREEQNR
jgi:two-component system cell cycle sensor histidine kinase/response regulator CckA